MSSGEIDEAEMIREMVLATPDGREAALRRIGRSIGGYWTAWGIFHGRRKDMSGRLIQRIRQAYLGFCRQQLAQAEARLRIAEGKCGNDRFEDIRSELADISARILEAERRTKGG